MDIISSLHNLEKKLTQLKPFLAEKESPDSVRVSELLTKFESRVDDIYISAESVGRRFEKLYKIDLTKMQIDPSGKPINMIAQKAAEMANLVLLSYNRTMKNVNDILMNSIVTISNYFQKDLLTGNQKAKFISILTELENSGNKLLEISNKISSADLNIFGNLKFQDFFEKLIKEFKEAQKSISFSIPPIKKLIENNLTFVKDDIQEIKNLERKIQEIYNQILHYFEQVKKFGAFERNLEVDLTLKNLEKISDFSLFSNLLDLIFSIKQYALFIKDNNLKKELLTALQSPNLKLSQKLLYEMNKVSPIDIPNAVFKLVNITIALLNRLEGRIQEAESALK